jgi:ATP/maltotriose-dependent transcriptional regulator MalT
VSPDPLPELIDFILFALRFGTEDVNKHRFASRLLNRILTAEETLGVEMLTWEEQRRLAELESVCRQTCRRLSTLRGPEHD